MFDSSNDEESKKKKTQGGKADNDVNCGVRFYELNRINTSKSTTISFLPGHVFWSLRLCSIWRRHEFERWNNGGKLSQSTVSRVNLKVKLILNTSKKFINIYFSQKKRL